MGRDWKIHDYLLGGKFEVVTDNNPLTHVNTTAKLDTTSHRWLAALANYDYKIIYRSGLKNADAGGLSRINHGSKAEREVIKAPLMDTIRLPDDTLLEETVN